MNHDEQLVIVNNERGNRVTLATRNRRKFIFIPSFPQYRLTALQSLRNGAFKDFIYRGERKVESNCVSRIVSWKTYISMCNLIYEDYTLIQI